MPFEGDWEGHNLDQLERNGEIVLYRAGFNLLRFPECIKIAWFDSPQFVEQMCRRYRGRIDAVWSCDEQFGCLIAAAIAERLGLPGTDPRAVVRAQHKLMMRQTLARELPEATVAAAAVPYRLSDRRGRDPGVIADTAARAGLQWPLFAKPVKATFSVLARRATSPQVLAEHIRLSWFDRYVMGRITRPFESLAKMFVPLPSPPDGLLLEEQLQGHQINVDGYAISGEFRVLGIVDEWTYADEVAGAMHFSGFTYPSRLGRDERDRVADTAIAVMRAIGFNHGLFNVELFVCNDGSIRVIEINPRAAGQFSTFYRDVEGLNLELMGIWLAAGRDPRGARREQPRASVAGSIVFRRFDGGCGSVPCEASRSWLASNHPNVRLWLQPTGKREVQREYRWLGSHRYAVLNCAAGDYADLQALSDECGRRLFGSAIARPVVDQLPAMH